MALRTRPAQGHPGRVTLNARGDLVPKTLCDLKKLLKSDFETYAKYVCDPSHVCRKCGRVANEKQRLCKPQRLKV